MKNTEEKFLLFIRYFFVTMVFVGFLYYLAGEYLLPSDNPVISYHCEDYLTEWTWIRENGEEIPVILPGKCDAERNERVRIETTLPEILENDTCLCFLSLRQDMELYIDDVLRQEYSTKDVRLFGKTSSAAYVFLELTSEDAGKKLTVISQTDSSYSGLFRSIYYGDKMSIWQRTFAEFGTDLIVAFLMIILGSLSVTISMSLRFCYHRKIDLEYLGWGILIAALWLLFNCMFRQLLFHNISVASDITFFLIMLLPFPFLVYMNSVQHGRYQKAYLCVGILAVFDLIICTILQVTNLKDFSETILYIEITCLLTILLIGATIIIDIFRKRIHEYHLIAIGILGTCLSAVAQILLYFHRIDTPFSGIMIALGLIFLLITAAISTIRDLFRMEQEKKEAILANEAKDKFLANMSHEIRTPINAVLGMDEMIIRESKEPNITEYALDIQNAGRSLLALINDILDFSKIESGSMQILPIEYELSSLLNDCHNMIHMRASDKNLDFRIENNPELPKRLYGDELRIRQIIINLLTNAVKYTSEGSVTMSLDGEKTDDGRLLLKISVKDTGMGISPENQSKLFHSFQRVEELKNRNIEGTGLGLAITKQLIDLMNGSISVESELGKGSVFHVELPQRIISEEKLGNFSENYMNAINQVKPYHESFQAPEGKILVVDDVPINLKVITALLKSTKLQIDTAESGQQCLEMITKKQYHMIFLDHMMPNMDGIETLQNMLQLSGNRNQETPVIMLTANALAGAKKEYLDAGFKDYLSKPVRENELEEMLLKYLPKQLILNPEASNPDEKQPENRTDVPSSADRQPISEAVTARNASLPVSGYLAKKIEALSYLDKLDFLDAAAGLHYCMNNKDLYLKILKAYLSPKPYELLTTSYENQDWKNYQIQVHALKSSSLSIGACELSETAKKLEAAAKESNIGYIKEHHEECMNAYRKLLSQLSEVLGSED